MTKAFSVGSKCAVMLPRELINEQVTPAKGMVINRLVGDRSLILVEEVWQFKGIPEPTLGDMFSIKMGRVRDTLWGWEEVPRFRNLEDYLIIPAQLHNMMNQSADIFTAMIKKSIQDFKSINNIA